jgi:hypothetical protein
MAEITKNSTNEEWTRITFRPDLECFGMDEIDEDITGLLHKRVYDIAGTVKDVKVFLNDERLKIKNFKQYVEMYVNSVKAKAAETSGGAAQPNPLIIHKQIGPLARWEVAFAVSDRTFQQVSFASLMEIHQNCLCPRHLTPQWPKPWQSPSVRIGVQSCLVPALFASASLLIPKILRRTNALIKLLRFLKTNVPFTFTTIHLFNMLVGLVLSPI